MDRTVYIVDGRRTPILRARGTPGPFSAADLAVACARDLLLRHPAALGAIDETVWGCVMPSENEANIARVIGLRLGLDARVPAHTVQRNCASGLQALDAAAARIARGEAELALAGGAEAMSRAPLLYPPDFARWLGGVARAKTLPARLAALARFRPRLLRPVAALRCGLTDPVAGLDMGQTAEELAHRFGIGRAAMDRYALESHELAARAQDAGIFADEIAPLYGADGRVRLHDDGVRRDSSLERLARLPAAFDRPHGAVTAGNSAQISDGAAALLLASEGALERLRLPALGILHRVCWAGLAPEFMGLGPVHAMRELFARGGVEPGDIDCYEINEAFAAQVLACLRAWSDPEYVRAEFGRGEPPPPIDPDRLNPHGGAVAVGHPVGMSGARLVLHLLKHLRRRPGRFGVAALCVGGGQGGAALVERVS